MKIDKKSKLGYSNGSPYRGKKYLDINTPQGLIDMSNTDIPLFAVDNTGYSKMLMPYSGIHQFMGNRVREHKMQNGGSTYLNTSSNSAKTDVYNSQDEIDQEDARQVDFAIRHNLVNPLMYHTGKKVGDQKLQYIDLSTGQPYDGRYQIMPKNMIKPMPNWVTDIGWNPEWNMPYYKDGNDIVYVDKHWYNSPRFIGHQKLDTKAKGGLTASKAHEMLRDGTAHGHPLSPAQKRYFGMIYGNSKKQFGGLSSMTGNKRYDFLFSDDEKNEHVSDDEKIESNNAPSESEIGSSQQQPDDSQNNLAMQLAMEMWSSSPYGSNDNSQQSSSGGISLQGIDPKVMAAASDILTKYPNLRITSGRRNWGDKDAHPLGRAIDISGPNMSQAFNYYKNVLVPKYGFNPALNPNHGTGPHIHIGYYQQGGLFDSNKTAYVDSVLNANKNLEWVKRLYDPNTPSIQVPGQKYRSTHLMSDDGNGYVFPSIQMINGRLQYLGDRAEDYARETNTGIQFPKVQGTWFADNGYKKGTGVLKRFNRGGKYRSKY